MILRVNRRVDDQNVVYLCKGLLLGSKEDGKSNTCHNREES